MNIAFIRGTDSLKPIPEIKSWTVFNLATRAEVNQVLLQSHKIISRSGYTSIMDYDKLSLTAELVATQGQSEQEYLAELHKEV